MVEERDLLLPQPLEKRREEAPGRAPLVDAPVPAKVRGEGIPQGLLRLEEEALLLPLPPPWGSRRRRSAGPADDRAPIKEELHARGRLHTVCQEISWRNLFYFPGFPLDKSRGGSSRSNPDVRMLENGRKTFPWRLARFLRLTGIRPLPGWSRTPRRLFRSRRGRAGSSTWNPSRSSRNASATPRSSRASSKRRRSMTLLPSRANSSHQYPRSHFPQDDHGSFYRKRTRKTTLVSR